MLLFIVKQNMANFIKQLDNVGLLGALRKYDDKWNFEVDQSCIIQVIQTKLNLNDLKDSDNVQSVFDNTNTVLIAIGSELKARGMIDTKDNVTTLVDYNRLLEKVHYAKQLVLDYVYYERIKDTHDYNANIDTTMFKFVPVVYDDLKPYQKLLYKLIDHMDRNEYRRVGEICYEQIMANGHGTHAWKEKQPIIDIINSTCNMVTNFGNWTMLTSGKELDKQITDHLSRTKDPRFPTLVKNRHVFAFKNGIYLAKAGDFTDRFIFYGSEEYKAIDKNVTACKYFDIDFEYTDNGAAPEDLSTPVLDSVYTYQHLTPEVIEINKMLLGRMLYDVGEMDNWQIIPFLLGAGGTGKSTINNIVRTFYDHSDVGIMGNNYQKTFGLADIYDKFAFVAPEIKRDWGIDQAEFQEIVSGGTLNVNIKHKASVKCTWTAPGMLGGNENPGFVDNASSIQRRVVVTRFDEKVTHGDPLLGKKLEREISAIMRQCNLYYLKYARQFHSKDIWNVLPDYFLETQRLMAAASNALFAFLDSDCVEFGEGSYIPMDEFFKRFNMFCSESNITRPKINVDFYRAPFSKYKLEVLSKCTKKYPQKGGRTYKNVSFIIGVDLKVSDEEFDF